jgi:signal transduction histidine kinase
MRFLLEKNVEHVKFIKNLVTDIEHNVIVPNMIYRLFLRRLRGKILKNKEIEGLLGKFTSAPGPQLKAEFEPLLAELTDVNRGLMEELGNIEKHHQSSSLFLETLLRRSHFDEGRLTLRTVSCDMSKAVIVPQLEQFADRFAEREIRIVNKCGGLPDEEPVSAIDVGLMAQVYSNLLSNALKYTQGVITEEGEREKYIACGKEILKDYFGPGEDGIKYSLFSTGPHIPSEECEKIFDEGYRGASASNIPGTGHGLAFVKNAVEIHGGVAGHEATRDGNNFYIIIRQG